MKTMKHQIMQTEGRDTAVMVLVSGSAPLNAGTEHPNFGPIVKRLRSLKTGETFTELGIDELIDLFDVSIGIGQKWARLSERVTAHHGALYLDGDIIADALSETILRFYTASIDDWQPLVQFLEKLITNPNEHSREHLFRWMQKNSFAIDQDGDIIAYKGLGSGWLSQHSGTAFVNGEKIEGRIPNQPNTIIEMPRSEVSFDPRNGCSTGLHAASWSFAQSFAGGGKIVAMKINPRDVVSVPVDSGDQKMRVCRYHCVGVVTEPITEALVTTDKRIARLLTEHDKKLVMDAPPEPKPEPPVTESKPPKRDPKELRSNESVTVDGHVFPAYFCDYKPSDFKLETVTVLRWLCGEWEVPKSGSKPDLVKRLVARRAWAKRNGR